MTDFRQLIELTQCFFCCKQPGDEDAKYEVAMHGNVERFQYGNTIRTTWSHTKINVRRCKRCKSIHDQCTSAENKGVGIGWAIVGVPAWLIIGGLIAADAKPDEGWIAFLLGGGLLGGGLAGLFGGLCGGIIRRRSVEKALLVGIKPFSKYKEHPLIKAKLAEKWGFGESP